MNRPHAETPVLVLNHTRDVRVTAGRAVAGTSVYAEVSGSGTADVIFTGNVLAKAWQDVRVKDASEGAVVVK